MRNFILVSIAFLIGPLALGAQDSPPKLKVCLLSGSEEYDSDTSLAAFQRDLEAKYRVTCVLLKARGTSALPGLEDLDKCDVAVFFTRRLAIEGEDLARVKKYCESGRPVVAIRTASHGFQNWLEFDKLVLGGNYRGHYANNTTMKAALVDGAQRHPVIAGVEPIASRGSLYKTSPLAPDATPLMMGSTPEGTQPVTWVRTFHGGRVFYTSLGAPGDFEEPSFRRLLTNAVFWTAGREAVVEETKSGSKPRAKP